VAQLEALAAEPLDLAPDEMDVAAFEEWTYKLAVQILNSLSPVRRDNVAKRNAAMLLPADLACFIRGRIFDCMSADEFRSRQTGERSGQFWLEKPLKFRSVRRAAYEAGLVPVATARDL
jgi:hypothetical protein